MHCLGEQNRCAGLGEAHHRGRLRDLAVLLVEQPEQLTALGVEARDRFGKALLVERRLVLVADRLGLVEGEHLDTGEPTSVNERQRGFVVLHRHLEGTCDLLALGSAPEDAHQRANRLRHAAR